ncbi:MAG TPA: Gfo/Idh/MocA family oxidoreductase [Planctomycetota bacterium]|nr:Gfo/Idh/MocA family oxidoreductase [Planctomycetota bacterium]
MRRRTFLSLTAAAACLSQVRADEKRVRVGLIGTAHSHAAGKLESLRKQQQIFEVVGAVEPDEARRKQAAATKTYEGLAWLTERELLEQKIDAVVIESSIAEFVPTALRCAAAGVHMHVEKPAGPSMPEFRRLAGLCREKKLVLQLGYMLRYNPAFEFCYRAAKEGWLGTIHELHGVIGSNIGTAARKNWALYPGGAMFELGAHMIDSAVMVLGKPTAVHSFLRRSRPQQDSLADSTLAVLEYPHATATIRSAAIDAEAGARRTFSIHGDKGSVTILPIEPPNLKMTLLEPAGDYPKGTHAIKLAPMTGRYDAQLAHFTKMIRGEASGLREDHDVDVHETLLRASGMPIE